MSEFRSERESHDGQAGGSALDRPRDSEGRGYGTAEVAVSGVDRSQLRRNLRLTPTERVERMVAYVRVVLPLQGILRRRL